MGSASNSVLPLPEFVAYHVLYNFISTTGLKKAIDAPSLVWWYNKMSNNIPFFVGNFGTKNYYYFHSDDVPVNSSRIHERTLLSLTRKFQWNWMISWIAHAFSLVLSHDPLEHRHVDYVTVNNILLFYPIEQWVCAVIDQRRCQIVIRVSVTHSAVPCVLHFFLTTFWCHLRSTAEQIHGNMESICSLKQLMETLAGMRFHRRKLKECIVLFAESHHSSNSTQCKARIQDILWLWN